MQEIQNTSLSWLNLYTTFYNILQQKWKKYKIPVILTLFISYYLLYITAQVEEIQKTSLARLLCDNMKFDKVARDSFANPDR